MTERITLEEAFKAVSGLVTFSKDADGNWQFRIVKGNCGIETQKDNNNRTTTDATPHHPTA